MKLDSMFCFFLNWIESKKSSRRVSSASKKSSRNWKASATHNRFSPDPDPNLIFSIRFTKPLYWWEKGGRDCGRPRRFGDSDTKYQLHSVIFCVEIKLESLGMTLLYLGSLRKRCLTLCVTWWGVTTHQASTGRGAGQPLPTPLPVLAWWIVIPHQVTPLFHKSFSSKRFQK